MRASAGGAGVTRRRREAVFHKLSFIILTMVFVHYPRVLFRGSYPRHIFPMIDAVGIVRHTSEEERTIVCCILQVGRVPRKHFSSDESFIFLSHQRPF